MEYEVHGNEPVSPTGQCLNSSVLSMSILGVLEFEIPINESKILSFLQDVFLNISPRFSSIMVDINGEKQWKRVEVKLRDHVHVPIFPSGMSPKSYDDHFHNYISNIILEQYPKDKPLWEVHIIKYPTSSAAGNLILKLHHALADNHLPLTIPSRRGSQRGGGSESIFRWVPETFAFVFDTVKDFSWNSLLQDDRTPIRSGNYGVEFLPMTISSMTFSLDEIELIKTKLNTTVNDVITGALFFATRLYMQEESQKSSTASCTALVLVNTRITHGDYKPIKEMIKPDSEMPWGNQIAFMPVTMPKLTEFSNPLDFVFKAQKLIKRKRSSFAVYVNKKTLEIAKKIRGYEGASRYMHSRLKNSSLMISNMIGPVEQMALADHPVRGFYFMVLGIPQDLIVTVVSYMGKLRIAFGTQKGLIDPEKFKGNNIEK
ncbi:Hypothetical predicted protein [Prunus dulcis]|uniref:O-acyltransferase WSD1 C-terminal domain-containing protein n=1 Tax=Prunus dulcis TaxID=3755 RepID=A0A5E4FML6_PRUDU|nr:Hypothetical predicted protein [Prunus dulcis]